MVLNPFLQKLLGSVVRSTLVAIGGFLSAQAVANPEQISAFVEASIPIVLGVALSVWDKYRTQQKIATTAALAKVTEHEVEAKIAEGIVAPVTVPKNEVPLLTAEYKGKLP